MYLQLNGLQNKLYCQEYASQDSTESGLSQVHNRTIQYLWNDALIIVPHSQRFCSKQSLSTIFQVIFPEVNNGLQPIKNMLDYL